MDKQNATQRFIRAIHRLMERTPLRMCLLQTPIYVVNHRKYADDSARRQLRKGIYAHIGEPGVSNGVACFPADNEMIRRLPESILAYCPDLKGHFISSVFRDPLDDTLRVTFCESNKCVHFDDLPTEILLQIAQELNARKEMLDAVSNMLSKYSVIYNNGETALRDSCVKFFFNFVVNIRTDEAFGLSFNLLPEANSVWLDKHGKITVKMEDCDSIVTENALLTQDLVSLKNGLDYFDWRLHNLLDIYTLVKDAGGKFACDYPFTDLIETLGQNGTVRITEILIDKDNRLLLRREVCNRQSYIPVDECSADFIERFHSHFFNSKKD